MNRALPTILIAFALAACGGTPDKKADDAATASSATGCSRFFPNGKPPELTNAKMLEGTKTLCRRSFVLLHSPKSRGPLWVAEELTDTSVDMAHQLERNDDFHPDIDLQPSERAELSDYRGSGYDRGHMAPSGDMPSAAAQEESFALSNMVPQAANLNRRSWESLEKSVRKQTRGGPVYVLTGPLYDTSSGMLKTTHTDGRLLIPSHTFKAVYAENRGAVVFIATNEDHPRWMDMTLKQFAAVYGINPFPGVPEKFLNVNGAVDGSLTRSARKNGAGGADGDAKPLDPNALVRSSNGQLITVEMYRNSYHRDPKPEEMDK